MSIVLDAVLEANRKYAETFGSKSELPIPPGRKFAIVTCMDARLDPAKFAGLAEGDAHVIRNAGGRVNEETIRSLIISHKLLGTQEWFVIHHTDCGMLTFTNQVMYDLLEESLESAALGENGWYNPEKEGGSRAGQYINFLPIQDLEQSVVDDVTYIRNHPLVSKHIPIYGYIYDCKTGKLVEVKEATEAGAAILNFVNLFKNFAKHLIFFSFWFTVFLISNAHSTIWCTVFLVVPFFIPLFIYFCSCFFE